MKSLLLSTQIACFRIEITYLLRRQTVTSFWQADTLTVCLEQVFLHESPAILSSSFVKKLILTLGPESEDYNNALTNLHIDEMLFVFVNITCPLKLPLFEVHLQKFMSELLTFLKPHLQPPLQFHNPCEWLSRVFIEQDDDMLEAAKASLSIYLQLTRFVYFKYF